MVSLGIEPGTSTSQRRLDHRGCQYTPSFQNRIGLVKLYMCKAPKAHVELVTRIFHYAQRALGIDQRVTPYIEPTCTYLPNFHYFLFVNTN